MKLLRKLVAEEGRETITENVLLISFVVLATVAVGANYGKSFAGVANAVNSNLVAASNFSK